MRLLAFPLLAHCIDISSETRTNIVLRFPAKFSFGARYIECAFFYQLDYVAVSIDSRPD